MWNFIFVDHRESSYYPIIGTTQSTEDVKVELESRENDASLEKEIPKEALKIDEDENHQNQAETIEESKVDPSSETNISVPSSIVEYIMVIGFHHHIGGQVKFQ